MWRIYSFKLAYAENNTFELNVNTNWSCEEFVEKVSAIARITFPSVSVTDEFHITESWNYLNNPNYRLAPSEENTPIPRISHTTILQRYNSQLQRIHFYIYFRDECQSLQLRSLRNESRTLEQISISADHYYYIWEGEQNYNNRIMRSSFGNTGNTGNIGNTLGSNSVVLDDLLQNDNLENSSFHLPADLFNEPTNQFINDMMPLDRNNIYNYTNQEAPFWSIPDPVIFNDGIDGNDDEYPRYMEPSPVTPRTSEETDCCICFTESIQCFRLENCEHCVCSTCYTGVYTRISGVIDRRCPMCRIDDSFNNNVYRQIVASNNNPTNSINSTDHIY